MAESKPQTNIATHQVSSSSHTSLSTPPPEKETGVGVLDLERIGEEQGYVLDEAILRQRLGLPADAVLKKAANGTVLIPQPTDDPQDPLNWSAFKKSCIVFMLAACACTADYSAATGASALIAQAGEWHISPNEVNHATAGNTFMLGIGGLVVVWFSAFFGRLPVLLTFMTLSSATAAWSAAAKSFESYMASRILNGFFCVAGAGGGLMWIQDVFPFHMRPKIINVWSSAIILSPFLGPQFMAAILQHNSWRVGMWLNFGIITFALLTVIFLGDETFYPRHLSKDRIPPRKSRVMRLIGVEQRRTRYTDNSFFGAANRSVRTIMKLPVFLTCLYYFFDFPWTIGNNTTISVFILPEYHFAPINLAAIYSAPVIGAILGLLSGLFLFDIIGDWYAKRHGGRIEPEARLIPLWIVLPLKLVGYNLIGTTLEKHWNYYVLAVGWGLHNYATILTTASVGAYLIDCYPEASGESAAWLNFARTLGGFIVGYVQINWAQKQGTQLEYGIQSAIMGAIFVLIIPFLQFGGGRYLRKTGGALGFKTN